MAIRLAQLAAFAERLGREIAAARVGVTAATLARWISRGLPEHSRFIDTVARALARHERSRRSAATYKRRQTELRRVQGEIQPPQEELREGENEYLDRRELLPRKLPEQSQTVRAAKRGAHPGYFTTGRYEGEATWVNIGRSVLDVRIREIADRVMLIYEASRRAAYNVRFLFLRYVPLHNPFYRGGLLAGRGEWAPFWEQTPIRFDARSIDTVVSVLFEGAAGAGSVKGIRGVYEMAESRVIWLEGYEVRTLDDLQEAPSAESVFRRPLF